MQTVDKITAVKFDELLRKRSELFIKERRVVKRGGRKYHYMKIHEVTRVHDEFEILIDVEEPGTILVLSYKESPGAFKYVNITYDRNKKLFKVNERLTSLHLRYFSLWVDIFYRKHIEIQKCVNF